MGMKRVYTVEADVRYSAKGHSSLWCGEILTVVASGSAVSAMKKAKAAMLKMTMPDGVGGTEYIRKATRVTIKTVTQGVQVDLL